MNKRGDADQTTDNGAVNGRCLRWGCDLIRSQGPQARTAGRRSKQLQDEVKTIANARKEKVGIKEEKRRGKGQTDEEEDE